VRIALHRKLTSELRSVTTTTTNVTTTITTVLLEHWYHRNNDRCRWPSRWFDTTHVTYLQLGWDHSSQTSVNIC